MFTRNQSEKIENMARRLMNTPLFKDMPLSANVKHRFAFTLAEVLITLLVIGVVASLTIPGIINSTNKVEYVTKLKKEHAVLMQAFNLIKADSGGSILNNPNFSSTTDDGSEDRNALNEFATKLNIVKNCGPASGCWYTSPLKFLGGTNETNNLESSLSSNYGKAILADGTSIMVAIYASSCASSQGAARYPLKSSVCGYIHIDINGAANPNTIGRDVFVFWITQTGIYPMGIFGDGWSCDISSSSWATSGGCAGKVLAEGAMNY